MIRQNDCNNAIFPCLNHDERVPAPQPRQAVGCGAGSYESHVSPLARKVSPDVQICSKDWSRNAILRSYKL